MAFVRPSCPSGTSTLAQHFHFLFRFPQLEISTVMDGEFFEEIGTCSSVKFLFDVPARVYKKEKKSQGMRVCVCVRKTKEKYSNNYLFYCKKFSYSASSPPRASIKAGSPSASALPEPVLPRLLAFPP